MIFTEMSREIKTASRAAAEEAKKRKDQHEDSDEALVDSEEEVNVVHRARQEKVSVGDVPAAPAEPDAPRDTPMANPVIDGAERVVTRLLATGVPLKTCARCKAVSYCGKECQAQHWKSGGHKATCKAPRK